MSDPITRTGSLQYGVQLPIQTLTRTLREPWEDDATVDDLVAVAKAAEDAGCAFIGVCDHVALPVNDYTRHMTPTWYDPISTLGFLAAHTSRARLLTEVFIAAYRHPLVAAKSFITLDHLSGGRVILGVGAGHVESEFDALGIDFRTRGPRTDESIDAMRAAFEQEYSQFSGTFYDYKEVGLAPRPVQSHVPIWIGGSGKPALRRVAQRGDGWIPQGTPRAQMRACVDYILAHRDKVRPQAHLDLGFMPEWIYIGTPSWDIGEFKLTGSPDQIAESLREANDLGCNTLHLHFRSRSRSELCDQLAAFGRDVAPLLVSA
ncbi:MAG TPA: TIGR03619 family F420-dependent LLM class oxidoreductase [Acidimicrobiales bacterium]|nr:TIGR03619 family F420-dependent LLM class oxidoreductase [Acidimicrobiales bacterium]